MQNYNFVRISTKLFSAWFFSCLNKHNRAVQKTDVFFLLCVSMHTSAVGQLSFYINTLRSVHKAEIISPEAAQQFMTQSFCLSIRKRCIQKNKQILDRHHLFQKVDQDYYILYTYHTLNYSLSMLYVRALQPLTVKQSLLEVVFYWSSRSHKLLFWYYWAFITSFFFFFFYKK